MTREFFRSNGDQESDYDKLIRTEAEKLSKDKFREKAQPEGAQLYQSSLEGFSFEWLHSEFRNIYQRAESDFSDKFGEEIEIAWDNDSDCVGAYNQTLNIVILNPMRMEAKIENTPTYSLDKNTARGWLLARILIHESVHAYSKTRCFGFEKFRGKEGKVKVQSGLETKTYGVTNFHAELVKEDSRDLNEGLVDFIAVDLFDRYVERLGFANSEEIKKFKDFFEQVCDPYILQKAFISESIFKAADDAGVGASFVYEAFIRQLISEGPLDKDLVKWMEKLFGKKLFQSAKKGKFFLGEEQM